jgi:hypothetical protein
MNSAAPHELAARFERTETVRVSACVRQQAEPPQANAVFRQ